MDKEKNTTAELPKILIIEHEPELRKIMKLSLEQAGMKVAATGRFANALHELCYNRPQLCLLDFDCAGGEPGKIISAFRENSQTESGSVIVTTATRLENGWRRKYQPDSVLYKPFDIRFLINLIRSIIAGEKQAVTQP